RHELGISPVLPAMGLRFPRGLADRVLVDVLHRDAARSRGQHGGSAGGQDDQEEGSHPSIISLFARGFSHATSLSTAADCCSVSVHAPAKRNSNARGFAW